MDLQTFSSVLAKSSAWCQCPKYVVLKCLFECVAKGPFMLGSTFLPLRRIPMRETKIGGTFFARTSPREKKKYRKFFRSERHGFAADRVPHTQSVQPISFPIIPACQTPLCLLIDGRGGQLGDWEENILENTFAFEISFIDFFSGLNKLRDILSRQRRKLIGIWTEVVNRALFSLLSKFLHRCDVEHLKKQCHWFVKYRKPGTLEKKGTVSGFLMFSQIK